MRKLICRWEFQRFNSCDTNPVLIVGTGFSLVIKTVSGRVMLTRNGKRTVYYQYPCGRHDRYVGGESAVTNGWFTRFWFTSFRFILMDLTGMEIAHNTRSFWSTYRENGLTISQCFNYNK